MCVLYTLVNPSPGGSSAKLRLSSAGPTSDTLECMMQAKQVAAAHHHQHQTGANETGNPAAVDELSRGVQEK